MTIILSPARATILILPLSRLRTPRASSWRRYEITSLEKSSQLRIKLSLVPRPSLPPVLVCIWRGDTWEQGRHRNESTLSSPPLSHHTQEIFGPILTVYVYPDRECDETLKLVRLSLLNSHTDVKAGFISPFSHVHRQMRHRHMD